MTPLSEDHKALKTSFVEKGGWDTTYGKFYFVSVVCCYCNHFIGTGTCGLDLEGDTEAQVEIRKAFKDHGWTLAFFKVFADPPEEGTVGWTFKAKFADAEPLLFVLDSANRTYICSELKMSMLVSIASPEMPIVNWVSLQSGLYALRVHCMLVWIASPTCLFLI